MALPSSGSILLSQVNTELGRSSNATISLGESAVRTLFAVPSGAISMSNGYGKANQFAFTISSNQTNANLATLATSAGWNGTSKLIATIGSGIYISSDSTGTPALTISGSFPGGVELVNNGYIVGMGGAGGKGGDAYSQINGSAKSASPGAAGGGGGAALSTTVAASVTNNGTIAGGGGGGGGGGGAAASRYASQTGHIGSARGGGGGGGGRSSNAGNSSAGGAGVATGKDPVSGSIGSVGTLSAAGAGGAGAPFSSISQIQGGAGSVGGGWGASGSTGVNGYTDGNTYYGGVWAAGGSGGSAGAAVTGNSNITWVATGTRLGSIS